MGKFLAFDFGASSGRALMGQIDHRITLEEIHRFPNPQIKLLRHYYWDFLYLFNELKIGLAKAGQQHGAEIQGIGVDTWGVDFGLIARDYSLLGNPVTYRDSRTEGMMAAAFACVPKREIYQATGVQFLPFNSIYQLFSLVKRASPLLAAAHKLLFMPDLMNFFMTGQICSEYTIASTSQLLNARTKQWEKTLFEKLNLPFEIMPEIIDSGTVIGPLLPELASELNMPPVQVIAVAAHDTGSAVAAVPAAAEDWAYLSSGTWSLIGIETAQPLIDDPSFQFGFTNEGGVDHTIRFLKNVMGMWLMEQCRKKWQQNSKALGYEALIQAAQKARAFKCIINPDAQCFLNPPDMPQAIVDFCQRTAQDRPESPGEFVRCILESLALRYKGVIDNINRLRTRPIQVLHVVGGGSQNALLNQFTANATGIPVIAGPIEATALGNILVQALAQGELGSLAEGRALVRSSFPLPQFDPADQAAWQDAFVKFQPIFAVEK